MNTRLPSALVATAALAAGLAGPVAAAEPGVRFCSGTGANALKIEVMNLWINPGERPLQAEATSSTAPNAVLRGVRRIQP